MRQCTQIETTLSAPSAIAQPQPVTGPPGFLAGPITLSYDSPSLVTVRAATSIDGREAAGEATFEGTGLLERRIDEAAAVAEG